MSDNQDANKFNFTPITINEVWLVGAIYDLQTCSGKSPKTREEYIEDYLLSLKDKDE